MTFFKKKARKSFEKNFDEKFLGEKKRKLFKTCFFVFYRFQLGLVWIFRFRMQIFQQKKNRKHKCLLVGGISWCLAENGPLSTHPFKRSYLGFQIQRLKCEFCPNPASDFWRWVRLLAALTQLKRTLRTCFSTLKAPKHKSNYFLSLVSRDGRLMFR